MCSTIIGVGCDIVEIARLKANMDAIANKVLTQNELSLFNSYNNHKRLEYLAGRFAGKEAIIKALNNNSLLSDIEILNDDSGKPYVSNINANVLISLAHEKNYAIAYAMVLK